MRISRKFGADMSNVFAYQLPDDPRLNPPEHPDAVESDDGGFIEVDFNDVEVIVNPDGSWEYPSLEMFDGPEMYGKWPIKGTYNNLWKSRDRNTVVEDIDALIEPMMPTAPGTYYISGEADLEYDILLSYYEELETPAEGEIDIELNYQDSEVKNFTCVRH